MASKTKPAKLPAGYNGWALLDGERGCVTLKDVLHNLSSKENGDNHEYTKGLVIGVLSTLVACGMNYEDACQLIWQCSPNDCHWLRIPEVLIANDAFAGKIDKATIPAS